MDTTLATWPKNSLVMGKGKLLPISAVLTIPAGLDSEIKTKLNSCLARTIKGLYCTKSKPEDLLSLALTLGQGLQAEAYMVKLYGYELAALHAFLVEQEDWFGIWWPGANRDGFQAFLGHLKGIIWTVDTSASRPITGIG